MRCSFCRLEFLYLSTCCMDRMSSPCSSSRPCNFSLFASCCAFFFSRQARLASLFFSLRDFVLWESLSAQSSKPNVKHVIKINDKLGGSIWQTLTSESIYKCDISRHYYQNLFILILMATHLSVVSHDTNMSCYETVIVCTIQSSFSNKTANSYLRKVEEHGNRNSPSGERHLADWCHGVYLLAKFLKFLPNLGQLGRVGAEVVTVASSRLPTAIKIKLNYEQLKTFLFSKLNSLHKTCV